MHAVCCELGPRQFAWWEQLVKTDSYLARLCRADGRDQGIGSSVRHESSLVASRTAPVGALGFGLAHLENRLPSKKSVIKKPAHEWK